jgi:polysaccharide pyruvyl transferase WcaK-like protein
MKKSKHVKVCVLGASFGTGNLGVSALAESSIKCILNCWPDAEITLLEGISESGNMSVNISGRDIELDICGMRFCSNIFVDHHFLKLAFYSFLCKVIPSKNFKGRIVSKDKCLKRIAEADFVIDVNAGDSFSDLYGKKRFILGFLRKWLVLSMGKKLIFMPQTYGPFKSRITRYLAKWLVKRSTAAYTRDKAGYEYLSRLFGNNIDGQKVHVVPDIAFILDAQRPDDIDSELQTIFESKAKPVVGLNISGLLYRGGYNESNMFGLKADYPKLVGEIIATLIDNYDVQVVLIPHVFPPPDFEVESDLTACMDACRSIDEKYFKNVYLVRKQYSHTQIKYIIGKCDFFAGARMHSCIAAMSQCVPTVGLSYSDKFFGVFEQVGNQQNVIEMREKDEDEIIEHLKTAFEQRDELRKHFKNIMPNIRSSIASLTDNIEIMK